MTAAAVSTTAPVHAPRSTPRSRPEPRSTPLGRGAAPVLAALTAAAAAVTVLLGVTGSPWTHSVGAVTAGAVGAAWGVALTAPGRTRRGSGSGARVPLHQRLMGAAGVVWGVPHAAIGVRLALAGGPVPSDWLDAVGALAGPLVVAALLAALPRAASFPRRRTVVVDGLLVGSAIAALVWVTSLEPLVGRWQPGAGTVAVAAVTATACCAVIAISTLCAMTTLDRALVLATLGGALFCAADLMVTATGVVPQAMFPWTAEVARGLGLPVALWAFSRVRGRQGGPARLRAVDPGVRAGALTASVLITSLLGVLLLTSLGGRHLDQVTGLLFCLVVALCAARQVVVRRERVRLLEDLTRQALTDDLTGLANRRALLQTLAQSAAAGETRGVVVVDLDGFAAVNDRLGQSGGDAVLLAVARGLQRDAPAGWVVHRSGGDAFALAGPGDETTTLACAERALAAVRCTSEAAGAPLGASGGMAVLRWGPGDAAGFG